MALKWLLYFLKNHKKYPAAGCFSLRPQKCDVRELHQFAQQVALSLKVFQAK